MKNKQIILISGKQGAGKTSLTNGLLEKIPRSVNLSLATPLRSLVNVIKTEAKLIGLDIPDNIETRSLMQFLGTDWARNEIDPLLWVKAADKTIKAIPADVVIIDDVRFQNEIIYWPNAFKIRLEADEQIRKKRAKYWGNPDHISETDLDFYDVWDLVAYTNSATKDEVLSLVLDKYFKTIWKND